MPLENTTPFMGRTLVEFHSYVHRTNGTREGRIAPQGQKKRIEKWRRIYLFEKFRASQRMNISYLRNELFSYGWKLVFKMSETKTQLREQKSLRVYRFLNFVHVAKFLIYIYIYNCFWNDCCYVQQWLLAIMYTRHGNLNVSTACEAKLVKAPLQLPQLYGSDLHDNEGDPQKLVGTHASHQPTRNLDPANRLRQGREANNCSNTVHADWFVDVGVVFSLQHKLRESQSKRLASPSRLLQTSLNGLSTMQIADSLWTSDFWYVKVRR